MVTHLPSPTEPTLVRSVADIGPALDQLSALEDSLVSQLNHLYTVPLSTPTAFLADKAPEVALLIGQSAQFLNLVSDCESIVSTLGTELKSYDLQLRHLDKAIDRIDLLSDIQSCATNVQAAMDIKDWETVAGYVERHLGRIKSSSVTLPPAASSPKKSPTNLVTTPQLSLTNFEDLPPSLQSLFPHYSAIETDLRRAEAVIDLNRSNLKKEITAAFRDAVHNPSNPDSESLRRCISLFPRIGEHELGVSMFTDYLSRMVAEKCTDAAKDLHQLDPNVNIQLITKLFDNIAMLTKQNVPMLTDKYGAGHTIKLIQGLHREGAKQALYLLKGWIEKRRLHQLLGMVKQGINVSAQELDGSVSEVVMILHRSDVYHRFIRACGVEELKHAREHASRGNHALQNIVCQIEADSTISEQSGIPLLSDFELAIKELSNYYITLESSYMRTNVKRAKDLDHSAVDFQSGPLLSSCVDDVFFLLKKCVFRALTTGDLDLVCTLLQEFESVVQHDFIGALHKQLESAFDAFRAEPKADTRADLMIQLNNLQEVVEYMPKFLEAVESSMQPLINQSSNSLSSSPLVTPIALTKVQQLVGKRKEKVVFSLGPYNRLAHHVGQMVHQHLAAMFETFLQNKVGSLLKNYLYTNYSMTEDEYLQLSSSNSYIGNNFKFKSSLSGLIANSKNELLHANLQILLLIMAEYCIHEWEKLVFSQSFSQFGSLYLERDVQSFATFVTNEAFQSGGHVSEFGSDRSQIGGAGASLTWTHSLREKMVLMHQMITVLTVSAPQEINDYWGSQAIVSMDWKLNAAQVRQLLGLRIEFTSQDLAKVSL